MVISGSKPESGQFIAIWVHAGSIWSSTYKIENGSEYELNITSDEWVYVENSIDMNESVSELVYVTKD